MISRRRPALEANRGGSANGRYVGSVSAQRWELGFSRREHPKYNAVRVSSSDLRGHFTDA